MATNFIDVTSRSLRDHYVFYDRLKDEENSRLRDLHSSVIGKTLQAVDAANRPKTLTTRLRKQAQQEREKECALLREVFGVDVSIDYNNPRGATEFIDIFNNYLNLRDVYERNKFLILNSKGAKGVFSYFPAYLKRVLDKSWAETATELDLSSEESIQKDLMTWLENSIPKAIEEMFLAKPELKAMPQEMKNAYKELLNSIGQVQTAGSFSRQIADIYKIDKIAEAIQQELRESGYETKQIKSLAKKCPIDAKKGGFTLEALQDLITASIQSTTKTKGGHATIGGAKLRADNVATFNIDITPIIESIEDTKGAISRNEAVVLFEQIDQRMGDQGRGFIIYTSDKNYTLNDGFKNRGGFEAGSKIKAADLESLIHKAGYNGAEFVGAILQFAEGAVAGNYSPQILEDALAQMIAFFLFDDYNALKAGLTNGTNTLHIMNLNGILVPMSSILFALADSIDGVVLTRPREIVNVEFDIPEIQFKTNEEQRDWEYKENASAGEAWAFQRNYALENTTIAIHFLSNLRELLANSSFR